MSTRHQPWPSGSPAWVDLAVPDLERAKAFYGPLFGWEFEVGSAETGYYTQCLRNGERAAAIGSAMPGDDSPPTWTTYLAAADVNADVARVEGNGGTVLLQPMPVMDFGSMAIVADATGAVVGLWQSGTHTGWTIVDEPGSVVWTEQVSHSLRAARTFYEAVFGYTYTEMDDVGLPFVTFEVDGETRGGLGEITPEMAGTTPSWLTYFGVADTDAAVEHVTANGGTLEEAAQDTPYGRLALVRGPFGERFAVMAEPTGPVEPE